MSRYCADCISGPIPNLTKKDCATCGTDKPNWKGIVMKSYETCNNGPFDSSECCIRCHAFDEWKPKVISITETDLTAGIKSCGTCHNRINPVPEMSCTTCSNGPSYCSDNPSCFSCDETHRNWQTKIDLVEGTTMNDTEPKFIPCEPVKPRSKYHREIKPGIWIDVYDVLSAFNVTNPADAHAIKKMLMPGQRGHKDAVSDRREAIASIERAIEIEEGRK